MRSSSGRYSHSSGALASSRGGSGRMGTSGSSGRSDGDGDGGRGGTVGRGRGRIPHPRSVVVSFVCLSHLGWRREGDKKSGRRGLYLLKEKG